MNKQTNAGIGIGTALGSSVDANHDHANPTIEPYEQAEIAGAGMKKQTHTGDAPNMHEEMRRAFGLLSGKWKLEIMWLLNQRVYRFGELRKAIPGITQHMLTAQLRELESDGLVLRTVYAEVPPKVEYEITSKARGLGPTMAALQAWWAEYGSTIPPQRARRGRKASLSGGTNG